MMAPFLSLHSTAAFLLIFSMRPEKIEKKSSGVIKRGQPGDLLEINITYVYIYIYIIYIPIYIYIYIYVCVNYAKPWLENWKSSTVLKSVCSVGIFHCQEFYGILLIPAASEKREA